MKTIFKSKLILVFLMLVGLTFFSCKTSSASGTSNGTSVSTDSDAIKAGDSTSINSGSRGTTRGANEGNEGGDPAPGDRTQPKQ